MNTKRILSLIVGCMLSVAISTSSVFAKEIPTVKERGPALFNAERIASALNLDPEQTVKLEKILATIQTRIENERPRTHRNIQTHRRFDGKPMARGSHSRLERGERHGPHYARLERDRPGERTEFMREERDKEGRKELAGTCREFDENPMGFGPRIRTERDEKRGPRGARLGKDRPGKQGEFMRGEKDREDRRELAVGCREFDEKPMGHGPRVRSEREERRGPHGARFGKDRPGKREFMRGERGREGRREIAMAQRGYDEKPMKRGPRERLGRSEGPQRRGAPEWNQNAGPRGPILWMNLTDDQRERIRDIIMEKPENAREDAALEKSESRQEILERMRERASRSDREFRPVGRRDVGGLQAGPGNAERGRGFRPFDRKDSPEQNER